MEIEEIGRKLKLRRISLKNQRKQIHVNRPLMRTKPRPWRILMKLTRLELMFGDNPDSNFGRIDETMIADELGEEEIPI